jgi:hypothetical protein
VASVGRGQCRIRLYRRARRCSEMLGLRVGAEADAEPPASPRSLVPRSPAGPVSRPYRVRCCPGRQSRAIFGATHPGRIRMGRRTSDPSVGKGNRGSTTASVPPMSRGQAEACRWQQHQALLSVSWTQDAPARSNLSRPLAIRASTDIDRVRPRRSRRGQAERLNSPEVKARSDQRRSSATRRRG